MYVTRLGHTNYCAVPSKKDQHDEWMLWMRTALDMALGTDGIGPPPSAGGVAISREALQRGVLEPPKPVESEVGWGDFCVFWSLAGCGVRLVACRGRGAFVRGFSFW